MHVNSLCPNTPEEVSAVFQGRPNHDPKWNPYSNTYNEGWKANPNFRWSNGDNNNNFKGSTSRAMVPQEQYSRDDDKLGQILKGIQVMNDNISKNEVRSEARFASIESKMEQMETRANNLSSYVTQLSNNISDQQAKNSGTMPSNTVINPKSVNAICLRSGKKVGPVQDLSDDEEVDEEIEVENPPKRSESSKEMKLLKKESTKEHESKESKKQPETSTHGTLSNEGKEVNLNELPFPHSYLKSMKIANEKQDNELLETFRKVEVNIPLLELIKKIPKYAKFLKELCTNKRKFKPNERVQLPSSVSALFKPQLPIKCQDPGSFTIHCTVGRTTIPKALLDLGAAINVMPKSMYESLQIKSLKPTTMMLQLADRTVRYPHGFLENILVKVKDLVIPADFYVLDMPNEQGGDGTLILGRPFLRTSNTNIDMQKGSITMSVGDKFAYFNMYEQMKQPHEDYSMCDVNVIDGLFIDKLDNVNEMHVSSPIFDSASPSLLNGSDVDCSAVHQLDYTLSTPSDYVITDVAFVKSSTNPHELEKGFVFDDVTGVSRAEKTSKEKKYFNLFRELRALNAVHRSVIVPVVIHPTISTPSTETTYQEMVAAPIDRKKVDSEEKSKEPTSLKLCFKEKKKIKKPSATFPPFSIDHYKVIDLVYEDPFLSTPEEAAKIKAGTEVWGLLSTYQTPKAEKRAKWIGPFEVQSTCQRRKVVIKDAEGRFFQVKKERLRFFKESYQPP